MRAERAPMTATPPSEPAVCRLLSWAMRVCSAAGICSVKRPSMERAITTKRAAKEAMIQGRWNAACTWPPAAANAVPAIV
jgi:hypothetical protein